MKSTHVILNTTTVSCEAQREQPAGPLPEFQLTPTFAHPRTGVIKLAKIRVHPVIQKFDLLPKPAHLTSLRRFEQALFEEPLCVTHEFILIDGYKRWSIAQELGMTELPCVIKAATSDEALICIIQKSKARCWLNDFCRIELALTFEEPQREQAREHQRAAGRKKHLAKLPEAQRIDVRRNLAILAGVSEGSFRKGRTILAHGIPELLKRLRLGTISIHAASLLARKSNDDQWRALTRGEARLNQERRIRALKASSPASRRLRAEIVTEIRQFLVDSCSDDILRRFRSELHEIISSISKESHDPSTTAIEAA